MPFTHADPHPAVTTDVVLFSIVEHELVVLLIRRGAEPYKGCWALPGGFLNIDEDLEACARRELAEETGVSGLPLQQFHTFGRPDRDPRERVISVVYFALAPAAQVHPRADSDAAAVQWFPLRGLPLLAFDHEAIIKSARQRLAEAIEQAPLYLRLTPVKFTLPELQSIYEVLVGRALDKQRFRKHILAGGFIEPCPEWISRERLRPARLYRASTRQHGELSTERAGL
ncbi:MAG: NUDIX hydrolase [Gammaproteobacteria bacterium]